MQELPTISDNCCRSCGGRIRAGIIQAFVQWNVGRCVLIVWQGWVRAFCARLGRTSIARGHRWSVAGCALLMCTSKTLHNMRTHTHACTHAHHTHVHTYTHTNAQTLKRAHTHTCTHARTHTHTCTRTHTHAHTRTHKCTHTHTHAHACTWGSSSPAPSEAWAARKRSTRPAMWRWAGGESSGSTPCKG